MNDRGSLFLRREVDFGLVEVRTRPRKTFRKRNINNSWDVSCSVAAISDTKVTAQRGEKGNRRRCSCRVPGALDDTTGVKVVVH